MNKPKHSPGPFTVIETPCEGGPACLTILDADRSPVATVCTTDGPNERERADAKLLAASPRLLASCLRLFEFGAAGGDTSWHSADVQPFFYEMMNACGDCVGFPLLER